MGEEQNVSVLISQAVELLCRSDAIPPPVLTWLKDGRPLLKKPGLSISEDGSVLKVNWVLRLWRRLLSVEYTHHEGTRYPLETGQRWALWCNGVVGRSEEGHRHLGVCIQILQE